MSNTRRPTGAAAQLKAEAKALLNSQDAIPVVLREQDFSFRPIKEWDIDAMADLDAALNGDSSKWRAWAEACLVDPTAWAKVRPRVGEIETIFAQFNELTGESLGKLAALSA